MDYKGQVVTASANFAEVGELTLGVPPSQFTLPKEDGLDGDILVTDGQGNVTWDGQGNGGGIQPGDDTNLGQLDVDSLEINPSGFGYTMPTNIGVNDFVLTANQDLGAAEWKELPPTADQELNTDSNVEFLDVTVKATLGLGEVFTSGYYVPSTRGAAGQVLTATGSAATDWVDPAEPNDQSLNTTDDVEFKSVQTDELTIGTTFGYTLPQATGLPNQVLTMQNGTGDTAWETPPDPFDQSLNTSDNVAFNRVTSQGAVIVGSANGFTTYALPETRGTNGQVLVAKGNGFPLWEDAAPEFDQSLNQGDDVTFQSVTAGSTMAIGDSNTTGYVFPPTRGLASGNVLTATGTAFPEWQPPAAPFDQELNTGDDAVFNSVATKKRKLVDGINQEIWEVGLEGGDDYQISRSSTGNEAFTLQNSSKRVKIGNTTDVWGIDTQMVEYGNGLQPRFRKEVIPDPGGVNSDLITTNINALSEESKAVSLLGSSKEAVMGEGWSNVTDSLSVGGAPPSIAELDLGELDFTTVVVGSQITQGGSSAEATFGTSGAFRALGSKQFIVPRNIAVGGYAKWTFNVSAISGNTLNFGIHFKDLGTATSYFGGAVGTAPTEYYLLTSNGGSRCYKGGLPQATVLPTNASTGVKEVLVNRVSTDLWTLSFFNAGVLYPSPVGECEFGAEYADKFLFFYISDTAPSNSSFTFTMTGFSGVDFFPSSYRYKFDQNANNQLVLSTPSGETAIQISPNNVMVNKAMKVANNICVQSAKFGYGCCVSSTIYKGSVANVVDVTGGVPAADTFVPLGADPLSKYGDTIVRGPIQPGQSYTVNMAGRISTGPNKDSLYLRVKMGNVVVGISTALESKMVESDLVDASFTLTATIVPWTKIISSDVTFVQCWGMMIIHNNDNNTDKAATNIGIVSTSYSKSLATATTVTTNADHDLQIEAYFEDTNAANTIVIDDHEIEMKAFNQ